MKKMVLVFTLVVFALTGSAFAQDPGNPFANNLGIYLNAAGTGSCGSIDADTPFTVFVIMTQVTYPEVWGWEAKFVFDNILNLGTAVLGSGINAGTREGEYIVGLSEPLMVANNTVILAEMNLMINGFFNDVSQPSNIFIEGIYFSLLDNGHPAYLESPGSTGVTLYPALGGIGEAQLTMNGDCSAVAVEETSFGSVKSLFR